MQSGTIARQLQAEQTAEELQQRVSRIKAMIDAPPPARATADELPANATQRFPSPNPIKNTRQNADPDMLRLDGMLDKLLRIQHPDLAVRDTGSVHAAAGGLLERPVKDEPVRVLGAAESRSENADATGFIEIGERDAPDSGHTGHDHGDPGGHADRDDAGAGHAYGDATGPGHANLDEAIAAIVSGDQTLVAGSTVALRLAQEASVSGVKVPAGQAVYGLGSLSGERLLVTVTSLRVGQSILPVSLQVYDLDGLPGIRVPGTVTREVSKQSAGEALGGLGMASPDPSPGAQAVNVGLQFARSLATRKVRMVRVSLPGGYRVLLRNTKSITN
ncbi:MAG TPA: conjugative transposon protein TraM [Puia sp.]|nr:conjugative transposon protein TraM [Puia sp.]